MTVYDLLEAIAAADDELLLRSEAKRKSYSWVKYAALAACVVLVVAAAFAFGRNDTNLTIGKDGTSHAVTDGNVTVTDTILEVTTTSDTSSNATTASETVTTSQRPEPIVDPGPVETDDVAPQPFSHSGGDENAWYYEPLLPKLGHISSTLFELVDEDEFNEWRDKVNVLYRKGEDVPTDINGFLNVYAMMNYFDISDEDVTKAFEYELSQDYPFFMNKEDLNVLLSRDETAILTHFQSDYSIVIGDRIYSPQWVYENSDKAYKQAGITPEMLKEKLGLYVQSNLTEDAKNYLINKINKYESSLSPAVGGSDYTFNRKYVDEVYNIHIASMIVGRDACDAWVNDVFLKKSPAEQEDIPPLYQIIVELEISKEDLINKNNEYSGPDQYLSDYIIDALYADDIETMKQLLMSPMALYYTKDIYTFDELMIGTDKAAGIPKETLKKYFDYIESVCEENGTIKYMQEDIDKARRAYGVEDENIGSLKLNGLEYVLNATWEPDIEMPELVTSGGDYTERYSAVNMKLNYISGQFCDIVGWDEAEKWLDERSTAYSDYTAVDEFANLYSFIKHFNIPDETVREILIKQRVGLEDDFTDEEIDLVLSDDTEAIAEHFAHENAICKGENLYSFYWIYNHSISDYIENGITPEDIEQKLPLYEVIPMSKQAKAVLMNKLNMYLGRTLNTATGGYYDSYEYFCNEYTSLGLNGEINFIRFTVLERVDKHEAYELTGKKTFEDGTSTLYKVQLNYDYLNDTPLEETVYLGRNEISQNYKPAYAIGETIVAHLNFADGEVSYCSLDEALEFAVYEVNGLEFAYHIGYEQIVIESDKYLNLNLEMAESEKYVITSTVDNPVHYTQKSLLSELTAFFGEDWAMRRMYFPLDEDGSVIEAEGASNYAYVVPVFNGSYDEKQCKFVSDSYWIESLLEILPEDDVYRFRDEVFYDQTIIEQAATPPLYQAVMYFGITRDELRAADKHLPEYVLDAIYCGNEAEMKQLLMNEYSIYHNGEVYALYDLVYRPSLRQEIPYEKRVEYVEKVRSYLESDTKLYERVYKKFIEEMLHKDL